MFILALLKEKGKVLTMYCIPNYAERDRIVTAMNKIGFKMLRTGKSFHTHTHTHTLY